LAVVFVVVGLLLRFLLSARASFAAQKVLAIVGQFFGLLGLLVGSYFVAAPAKLRMFLATWLAVSVGHLVAFTPMGMVAAASVCWFFGYPSSAKTASLAFGVMFYSLFPLVLLEEFVVKARFWSVDARLKMLTALLLIGGLLLQLCASILDFLT